MIFYYLNQFPHPSPTFKYSNTISRLLVEWNPMVEATEQGMTFILEAISYIQYTLWPYLFKKVKRKNTQYVTFAVSQRVQNHQVPTCCQPAVASLLVFLPQIQKYFYNYLRLKKKLTGTLFYYWQMRANLMNVVFVIFFYFSSML